MSVEPPATPHDWKAGDLAKNISALYRDTIRTVQQVNIIEDNTPTLIVRADESLGEKSPVWTWFSIACVFIAPIFNIGDHVTLGTGKEIREVLGTRPHDKTGETQYRVDLPNELKEKWVYAIALHRVEAPAPVAYEMKETDSAADPRDADALLRAAQLLADEQEKVIAAEKRAKDAEELVKKLEQIIRNHEAYAVQPQPVPVALSNCVQYKTVTCKAGYPADLEKSDAEVAHHVNDGWETVNYAYVPGSSAGELTMRFVTLKRTVSTPVQPTRGSAGHHADLTSDYPLERKSTFERTRVTVPTITSDGELVEDSSQQPQTLTGLVGIYGAEVVGAQMDKVALDKVLARRQARHAAAPIYQAFIPFKVGE